MARKPTDGDKDKRIVALRKQCEDLNKKLSGEAEATADEAVAGAEALAKKVESGKDKTIKDLESQVKELEETLGRVKEKRTSMKKILSSIMPMLVFALKLIVVIGGVAAAVLMVYVGYEHWPVAKQVASNTRNEDTRTIAESDRSGINKLSQAILSQQGQLDKLSALLKERPSSAIGLANWQMLNVETRSAIFAKACPKVDWDSVNTESYEAGLANVSQAEAMKIVPACDVSAIIKKAPATTTEASNNNPAAAEDQKEPTVTPAVAGPDDRAIGNTTKARYVPSPWAVGPEYRRPGYGRGRAYCKSGRLVDGDTSHPKCEHHVTDQAALDSVAGHHRSLDPDCHEDGQVVRHVIRFHGRWAVGTFTCHLR